MESCWCKMLCYAPGVLLKKFCDAWQGRWCREDSLREAVIKGAVRKQQVWSAHPQAAASASAAATKAEARRNFLLLI